MSLPNSQISRREAAALIGGALAMPFVGSASAQQTESLETRVAGLDQLHSIQVQRGDEVVFSQVLRGRGLDAVANIKSCSKSIVALLLGSCLGEGDVASVDARLVDVAPGLIPSDATAGVADLTMENLVTLSAGLEATSGGNYGSWVASDNWVDYVLTRPMVAQPGGSMVYSTGTTHVLGAALAEASGRSLLALARERLGEPMGLEIPPWIRDPQGFYLGGNEMGLTPRAMLAIAQMMRDRGRFGDQQIVPQTWIEASIVPRVRSPFSGMLYGYGWFVTDSGYVLARGYGGQVIAAHREANLAVAITSDQNTPARSFAYFGDLVDLLDGPVLALTR